MKYNKFVYFIICLFFIFNSSTVFSQGYDIEVKLYYNIFFEDPFQQGQPWYNINEDIDYIKSYVLDRVSNDLQSFGISVSETESGQETYGSIIVSIGKKDNEYDEALGHSPGVGCYYHDYSATCKVFTTGMSLCDEWRGDNVSRERVAEAIAGVTVHEVSHCINLYHAYGFATFDPSISGALDSDYYPKMQPYLPSECTNDPASHVHVMTSTLYEEYKTYENYASSNMSYSDNSRYRIKIAKDAGGNIGSIYGKPLNWGIKNKTFKQYDDLNIYCPSPFIIGAAGHTYDMNGYNINIEGDVLCYGSAINLPGPTGISSSIVPNGIELTWDKVACTSGYKIYRKPSGGNFSYLTQVTGTNYTDSNVNQGTNYTYYVKSVNSSGEWGNSAQVTETTPGPLTGNISYDVYPSENDWVNFTANVTGGNGSGNYSYAWYRAPENDPDNWTYLSSANPLYLKCDVWGFFLKCDVEDDETIASGTFNASYGCAKRYIEPEETEMPDDFNLFNNYPNPFNPETTIKYALPEASKVSIKVYDVAGREVAKLTEGNKSAGYHTVKMQVGKMILLK